MRLIFKANRCLRLKKSHLFLSCYHISWTKLVRFRKNTRIEFECNKHCCFLYRHTSGTAPFGTLKNCVEKRRYLVLIDKNSSGNKEFWLMCNVYNLTNSLKQEWICCTFDRITFNMSSNYFYCVFYYLDWKQNKRFISFNIQPRQISNESLKPVLSFKTISREIKYLNSFSGATLSLNAHNGISTAAFICSFKCTAQCIRTHVWWRWIQ